MADTDKTLDQLNPVVPTDDTIIPVQIGTAPMGKLRVDELRDHLFDTYEAGLQEAADAAAVAAAAAATSNTAEIATAAVSAAVSTQVNNATQVARDAIAFPRAFQTITAAMAVVADNEEFLVPNAGGFGAFRYRRSGSNTLFQGAQFYGTRGQQSLLAQLSARNLTPYPTRGLVTALWGINSRAWDGRVIPNEVAPEANPPTLNILSQPLAQVKENASATPTHTFNYATVPDPLGGTAATLYSFTAIRQPLTLYRSLYATLPAGDYRVAVAGMRRAAAAGAINMRMGTANTATKFGVVSVLDTAYSPYEFKVTGYANSYDLAIASNDDTFGDVVMYGPGIYDDAQGSVLPTSAQIAASHWGHAKRPFAYSGSIQYGPGSSIDNLAAAEGMTITLPGNPVPKTFTQITLSAWVSVTAAPATTAGNVLCIEYSPGAELNTNNARAQLAVYATTGEPYMNPNLAAVTGKVGFPMVGKGFRHLTITLKDGEQVYYLDGVPFLRTANAFSSFQARALRMLAYNGTSTARVTAQLLPGYTDGVFVYDVALTSDEVRQLDRHGRQRLRLNGATPGDRKIALIGGCDSITAFSNSWAWQGSKDATFGSPLPFFCEAVGGSSLSDWLAREATMNDLIDSSTAAGFQPVVVLTPGANEYARWRTDLTIEGWLADFLAYAGRIRARGAKVVIGYMLPRADGGADVTESELYRQALLSFWDANWSTYFDARMEFGRDAIMGLMATSQAALPLTGGDYTWFQAGGTHPSDAGHARLWAIAKPVLQSIAAGLSGVTDPSYLQAIQQIATGDAAVLSKIGLDSSTALSTGTVDMFVDETGGLGPAVGTDGTLQLGDLKFLGKINGVTRTQLDAAIRSSLRRVRYRGRAVFPFDINILLISGQSNSEGAQSMPLATPFSTPRDGVLMMDAIRARHFTGTRRVSGLTPAVETSYFDGTSTWGTTPGRPACDMVLDLVAAENNATFEFHGKYLLPMCIGRSSSSIPEISAGAPSGVWELAVANLQAIKDETLRVGSPYYGMSVGIIGLAWLWGADGYEDGISAATWQSQLAGYFSACDTTFAPIFGQRANWRYGIVQTSAHAAKGFNLNPYGAVVENTMASLVNRIDIVNPEGPMFFDPSTENPVGSAVHHSGRSSAIVGGWIGRWLKRTAIDRETWGNFLPTVTRVSTTLVKLTYSDLEPGHFLSVRTNGQPTNRTMQPNYGIELYNPASPSTPLALAQLPWVEGDSIYVETAANLPPTCSVRIGAGSYSGNFVQLPALPEYAMTLTVNGVAEPIERWLPIIDIAVPA